MKRKIFSILFALVLVLSFSLVAAVPAAAVSGDVEFTTEGSGTWAWSTDAFHSGSYSVLLTATNPDSASVGVEVEQTPLADITQLSFAYNHQICNPATGHVLGPDMVLILTDGILFYVAGRGGALDSGGIWQEANPITGTNFAGTSRWWYGSLTGTDITSYTKTDSGLTFAGLQSALSGAAVLYAAVNLDPPGAGSSGSVYVDDITVNDTTYDLEPPAAVAGVEITSTGQGPYIVDVEQGFSIKTTSDTQYSPVLFKFVVGGASLADITSFKYFDAKTEGWVNPPANPDTAATDTWLDVPLAPDTFGNLEGYFGPSPAGFTMPAGYDVTTKFKIKFAIAKVYPVTVSLVALPSTVLTSVNFSVEVLTTAPNSVASSTMIFEGPLANNGGVYTGTIPMVDEVFAQLGDFVAGFDVYARNGAEAVFADERGLVGPTAIIAGYDAWPTWTPDTPDWDYYALTLTADSWQLVYNQNIPRNWAVCGGVPMSGTMDWNTMYASETNLGYCFGNPVNVAPVEPTYIGWAALHGGGAACWDMDWLWGAEVVPLQYAGFAVTVTDLDGGNYRVTMTPAAPTAVGMTASFTARLGISVTPTSVDFGNLVPGTPSLPQRVTVTNTGNVAENFSASIESESPENVYTGEPGLKMDSFSVSGWGVTNVAVAAFVGPDLVLTVPTGTAPGTYTATLVFWTEMAP